ncbi:CS domain-containing protein [Rhizoctonia solani AG-1 IA]|uniref:Nuclear movement protein nudC n=1 Tax=Thanatephorus cucumeris (strain AG1-IA) TaxID=983506 RepID=L8WYT0_THACA|nr:CS domain-containing protein [Rhizoctonia solani AG-1 IA]
MRKSNECYDCYATGREPSTAVVPGQDTGGKIVTLSKARVILSHGSLTLNPLPKTPTTMPTIEEVTEDVPETKSETKEKTYDEMTPAEREVEDAKLKAREAAEQATLPYQWKQELGDLDITVPLPKGTRARDLAVKIQKKKLAAGLKGKEPILEGELCQEIKLEESTWTVALTIEDAEFLCIHLEKVNKWQWWENVLTHHPKIDTRKITPNNSKLSDLDGETR